MVEYGVTNTGFVTKSYSNISTDIENRFKTLFGNEVDLTPGSPLKLMADLFGVELSKLWVELENTYNSGFIETSNDSSLENLGDLVGIDRRAGTAATDQITFLRTVPLPSGSPRIIPANTSVQTADAIPLAYTTTSSVYMYPSISAEEYSVGTSTITSYNTDNYIYTLTEVSGSDAVDYTSGASFTGRTITLSTPVPSGATLYTSYAPISVTTDIQAAQVGTDYNVVGNTITVQTSPLDFIHSIRNDEALITGTDSELDFTLRERIKSASIAIGNATELALSTNLQSVTGVTNVVVESPYLRIGADSIAADGTTIVTATNIPIDSVTSVSGSSTGLFTVSSFDTETGDITVSPTTSGGETVTIDYQYQSLGEIKLYINGGVVGDIDTVDTLIYTIENTRAAGIKSIGYLTGDLDANGSATAPFSWFYRPGTAEYDVTITLTWDTDSTLSTTEKTNAGTSIINNITTFINALDMYDKLYKNKLLQIAISENEDIIDATLTSWALDNVSKSTSSIYLQGTETEIPVAGIISVI